MLTEEQIEQFRILGLLVLPGALDGVMLGALIEEVDAAIAAAGPVIPRAAESRATTSRQATSERAPSSFTAFSRLRSSCLGGRCFRSPHSRSCSSRRLGGTSTSDRTCQR
jgi:hypothetical protein